MVSVQRDPIAHRRRRGALHLRKICLPPRSNAGESGTAINSRSGWVSALHFTTCPMADANTAAMLPKAPTRCRSFVLCLNVFIWTMEVTEN
jgi:hypothetical protein